MIQKRSPAFPHFATINRQSALDWRAIGSLRHIGIIERTDHEIGIWTGACPGSGSGGLRRLHGQELYPGISEPACAGTGTTRASDRNRRGFGRENTAEIRAKAKA